MTDTAPKSSVQLLVRGEVAALPLEGIVDLSAERARLEKEIQRIAADVGKIDAKLGNADFIARAPEEVVEEQRDRRDDALSRKAKIEEALNRLGAHLTSRAFRPGSGMNDLRPDPRAGVPHRASALPAFDLAAVTLLALVARIVWHLVVPARDWPDTAVYLQTGHALLSSGFMSSSNYMPVYPLAISLTGHGGIVPVQLVVSAFSVALVQVITFDVFGSRQAALFSGLIAALYPPLIFYANMRLTETIYIALVLVAFASFYRGAFLVGSISLVVSILTRPSLDLLAPLLVVAFCVVRRETGPSTIARRLALYGLVYVALMAPWWWHNWRLYHAFVRLDLAMGNLLIIENHGSLRPGRPRLRCPRARLGTLLRDQ